MVRLIGACAAAGYAALAVAAGASIPMEERLTCPVGGERFTYETTAAYSTWGARPDGKPYGSWQFPAPLPVCPSNGLVMYKTDYSAEEVLRLRPLVESTEYRALRQAPTYYQAWWLMSRMDAPQDDRFWVLVQAVWQTDADPLRRRLLEELVLQSRHLGEPADEEGLAARARTANALRELGRFDEAAALLANAEPLARRAAPDSADGWIAHYRSLATLIERRDTSIEPVAALPPQVAAYRCRQGQGLSAFDREDCPRIVAEAGEEPEDD